MLQHPTTLKFRNLTQPKPSIMKKYIALFALSLICTVGHSQKSISITHTCSYYGEKSPATVYTFDADTKATASLFRITEAAGLPKNFTLVAGNVDNACATIVYNAATKSYDRYIIYNQTFMQRLIDKTNDWAALSIFAHEVGHHLSGHSLQLLGSRPDLELEADKFSGFISQKLGATLEQTQLAVNQLTQETYSKTHPPKSARLAALANGWYSSYNQTGSNTKKTPEAATRPTTFIEYNNMPKWYKNSSGSFVLEKNGYTYPSNEFKTITLLDNNHLFVYSTTEQVSFYCENFQTATANTKSKITTIDCYGDKKNIYVVKHKNGGFYIIDKGENIPTTGSWVKNGWDDMYQANGNNGKKYFLLAGYDYSINKTVLAYAAGEPSCVYAVR